MKHVSGISSGLHCARHLLLLCMHSESHSAGSSAAWTFLLMHAGVSIFFFLIAISKKNLSCKVKIGSGSKVGLIFVLIGLWEVHQIFLWQKDQIICWLLLDLLDFFVYLCPTLRFLVYCFNFYHFHMHNCIYSHLSTAFIGMPNMYFNTTSLWKQNACRRHHLLHG